MASTTAATMPAAAPRQCQLLPHIKKSFEHAVQGFWNALKKQRAAWKPSGGSSCIPSLPFRRNGHFSSLVNKIATWPRLASHMASRERSSSSPNAQQPGSSSPAAAVAACRYSLSFPGPGLPSASLTVVQSSRTKYSSNILEYPRQQQTTSSSIEDEEEDGQEDELQAAPGTSTNASENSTPIYIASPDTNAILWEMQDYILKGIMEVQQLTNGCAAPEMSSHGRTASFDFDCGALTMIPCNSEAEHDGAGDYSSVTTVSENGTASSSAASQELLTLENGTASSSPASQELLQEPAAAAAAAVQEQGATAAAPPTRFKGIRQKENKWISEIRPSCSKKTVWLGTYKTQEEAALAYDAGIFYYQKFGIPYNFPDSPKVLPAIKEGPQDVSTKFVKTEARRNAQRAWSSSPGAAQQQQQQQLQALSSSASFSLGWSNPCKKRKTNSRCWQ
ncbi:unnamed protein product [Sphagnum jensenii]|uniref:AP2/ERF domain-containing protein n=1 Tax=Sphagnum jensenii TaxID=128206 RepID=A0ABP1BN15_9BRYO